MLRAVRALNRARLLTGREREHDREDERQRTTARTTRRGYHGRPESSPTPPRASRTPAYIPGTIACPWTLWPRGILVATGQLPRGRSCSGPDQVEEEVVVPGGAFEFSAHGIFGGLPACDVAGEASQQGEVFGSVLFAVSRLASILPMAASHGARAAMQSRGRSWRGASRCARDRRQHAGMTGGCPPGRNRPDTGAHPHAGCPDCP